jgi:type II secretory pathway pseudopilin PulG
VEVKVKSKFKKEGNVIIMTLFFVMIIMILTAVVFSYLTSVEASRKAARAAQIVAETRALAIDTHLKERYGYIEILHKTASEGYTYDTVFPKQPAYNTHQQGYDKEIYSPSDVRYVDKRKFADSAAKRAGIAYIDGVTKDTGNNTKLLNITEENICINVISLPVAKISDKILTCGPITLNGVTKTQVMPKTVPIYGSTHPSNIFSGVAATDLQNKISNYNFVFVLITYQEQTFFYKAIQRFVNGDDETTWTPPPDRTVWSIAYPQIDFCSGGDC